MEGLVQRVAGSLFRQFRPEERQQRIPPVEAAWFGDGEVYEHRQPLGLPQHRARIDLPHGFEYEIAEIGSASGRSRGTIALELKNSYAQLAHLHLNNKGPIRHRTTA